MMKQKTYHLGLGLLKNLIDPSKYKV